MYTISSLQKFSPDKEENGLCRDSHKQAQTRACEPQQFTQCLAIFVCNMENLLHCHACKLKTHVVSDWQLLGIRKEEDAAKLIVIYRISSHDKRNA